MNAVCWTSTDITGHRDGERAKRQRVESTAQIHEAMAQGRFILQGQPIINLASGKVEQAELLIRMRRTTGDSDLGDDANRQVVEAIIGVAHQFGIKTVAEGVEDQATLEALVEMGVDKAQGYWIGRPAPLDELWSLTAVHERT